MPSEEEGGPQQKGRVLSSSTRIYVIKDKLEQADVDRLRAAISTLGGMNASLRFANLILTGTKSAKRAQKFVDADAEVRRKELLLLLQSIHATTHANDMDTTATKSSGRPYFLA